jgi:hypothetical protein
VIEKANNAVRNAYCYSQWISIHQGNDSYWQGNACGLTVWRLEEYLRFHVPLPAVLSSMDFASIFFIHNPFLYTPHQLM